MEVEIVDYSGGTVLSATLDLVNSSSFVGSVEDLSKKAAEDFYLPVVKDPVEQEKVGSACLPQIHQLSLGFMDQFLTILVSPPKKPKKGV